MKPDMEPLHLFQAVSIRKFNYCLKRIFYDITCYLLSTQNKRFQPIIERSFYKSSKKNSWGNSISDSIMKYN